MGQFQRHGRGERQHQQPAPKPFDFVPLPKRVTKKRPTGHDRYHEMHTTGQIHGTIEALSPIQIGSGVIDLGQDVELIKTAVRTGGNIVIPEVRSKVRFGASLKRFRRVASARSQGRLVVLCQKTLWSVAKKNACVWRAECSEQWDFNQISRYRTRRILRGKSLQGLCRNFIDRALNALCKIYRGESSTSTGRWIPARHLSKHVRLVRNFGSLYRSII